MLVFPVLGKRSKTISSSETIIFSTTAVVESEWSQLPINHTGGDMLGSGSIITGSLQEKRKRNTRVNGRDSFMVFNFNEYKFIKLF